MNNKIIKKFISILIIACMFSFTACKQSEVSKSEEQPAAMPTERVQNAEFLSGKDIKTIKQQIDSRVETVKNSLNYKYHRDYYDGDVLVYRYFEQGSEDEENFAGYQLYYDAQGKLIFAEIGHYCDAHYSIYFYNDELLCTEPEILAKRVRKTFLSQDISLCLEYSY